MCAFPGLAMRFVSHLSLNNIHSSASSTSGTKLLLEEEMGGEWGRKGREWVSTVLTGSQLLLVCTNKDVSSLSLEVELFLERCYGEGGG